MKLSFRTSITAAVLTVAATVGLTVGTVAPASAASCTEIHSVYGNSRQAYGYRFGYALEVSPTLRLTATSNCSPFLYRATAYVYTSDGQILAQKTVSGSWGGSVSFGAMDAGIVDWGTSSIGVGVKTEFFYQGTWRTSQKDGWGVKVTGYAYDTATGANVVGGGCNATKPSWGTPYGYNEWCYALLPF